MTVSSRSYTRAHLDDLLRFVARSAAERWPTPPLLLNSDIIWQLPGSAPKDNLRLWFEDSHLVGIAWYQPPSHLHFDIEPEHASTSRLFGEMMAWLLAMRAQQPAADLRMLSLTSMDEWASWLRSLAEPAPATETRYLVASSLVSDQPRNTLLEASGFKPSGHYEPFMIHSLDNLGARPPADIEIRPAQEADFAELIATHRAAWAPSTGLSLERFLAVRQFAGFDPELCFIADTPQNEFAGTCTFWTDPLSSLGSLEPMGMRPGYRGTGISKAMLHHGLRALKDAGMKACRIYTAGFNQPAQSLYKSAGFIEVNRSISWVLET